MSVSFTTYSPSLSKDIDSLLHELEIHEHQFDVAKTTNPKNASKYRQELLKTIASNSGEMILAIEGDKCVGLITWYIESELEYDLPYAYISDLVVSKNYRHQGIGKMLLNKAVENIKQTSAKRIHIGVLLANTETKSFYEKNGFTNYSIEMVKVIGK